MKSHDAPKRKRRSAQGREKRLGAVGLWQVGDGEGEVARREVVVVVVVGALLQVLIRARRRRRSSSSRANREMVGAEDEAGVEDADGLLREHQLD